MPSKRLSRPSSWRSRDDAGVVVTRIVGGAARGRRLVVPSAGTRPTSDRAREAVFSSLESMRGPWQGAHVLDLYAGSGACGLEALSRGAARVDLVDEDRAAVAAITANRDAVLGGLSGSTGAPRDRSPASIQVHRASVARWVLTPPGGVRYDVVFCDPPYVTNSAEVADAIAALADGEALAGGSLVVVERSARDKEWQWREPFDGIWNRRYGEARLWIAEVPA